MSPAGTTLILLFACARSLTCLAQSPPPSPPDATPPPMVMPLPSPPDMPLPDPLDFPKHDDKTKSPVKRAVDKLSPVCLNVVFHSCLYWRDDNAPPLAEADREYAKNFEVGNIYFYGKNYRAAESRFREALQHKPDEPEAMFKLAVSLEKLGRSSEAVEVYQSYLKVAPTGQYADRARKALARPSSLHLR